MGRICQRPHHPEKYPCGPRNHYAQREGCAQVFGRPRNRHGIRVLETKTRFLCCQLHQLVSAGTAN